MAFYSFNSNPSIGSDYSTLFNPFAHHGSGDGLRNGSVQALPHSLVLDSEKGELVKAPARVGKKGVSEAKALAALKNHSEAERRRRERINAHLSALRGLVPCTEKVSELFHVLVWIKFLLLTLCFSFDMLECHCFLVLDWLLLVVIGKYY